MKKAASQKFFAFARERHRVYLKRMSGLPAPWTGDPVLRGHRFTNIFRELDTTTLWFRQNIRHPLRKKHWVIPATVIFRWFNRITTGEVMLDSGILSQKAWSPTLFEQKLREAFPQGPWVTGSYMVFSGKNNGDKLTGLLSFIDGFDAWWERRGLFEFQKYPTMERAHQLLMEVPGLSGFTAYEVVTDLRWTEVVSPGQRNIWAHAGPGAVRGMSRLLHGEDHHLQQGSVGDQLTLSREMRSLLNLSRSLAHWPQFHPDWPVWELREVEHTLCEYDKYERIRREQGQTKRRFYEDQAGPLPGADKCT